MNKKELQLCKKKILKCLTEEFSYGKTKKKLPRKHPLKNIPLFDKKDGRQIWFKIDLDEVMKKVVLGLYFALDDQRK